MLFRVLNQFFRNPTSLSNDTLEYEWAYVKGKLLRTCPYKNEISYKSLYERCDNFLKAVSQRHKHFILDAEAKCPFYKHMKTHANCLRMIDPTAFDSIDSVVLYGLILAAYTGEKTQTMGGFNLSNPRFVISGVDFLINNRKDPVGLFLKGLILKYGIRISSAPNLNAAVSYLKLSNLLGVGSATIELENLHNHRGELSTIVSIHDNSDECGNWAKNATSALETEITLFQQ